MIDKPEFVSDLVRQTRNACRDDLIVSVKIRIHSDYQKTIELCRNMEHAGAHFITVHGRTKHQRSDPVNWEASRNSLDAGIQDESTSISIVVKVDL